MTSIQSIPDVEGLFNCLELLIGLENRMPRWRKSSDESWKMRLIKRIIIQIPVQDDND